MASNPTTVRARILGVLEEPIVKRSHPTTGDERLRAALQAAKAEWEGQLTVSDEELAEFEDHPDAFAAYHGQQLINRLFDILQAMDGAAFMRIENHG